MWVSNRRRNWDFRVERARPRDSEKETNEANESLFATNGGPFILSLCLFLQFPFSDVIGRGMSSDSRGERAQILALVDRKRKRPLYGKSSRFALLVQF